MKVSPIINAIFSIGSTSLRYCRSKVNDIADPALRIINHLVDDLVIHNQHGSLAAVQGVELVTTINHEYYDNVPTIFQFARAAERFGCDQFYTLDGGQTASIAMNDQLINAVDYGSQRKISDIIYFATAVPEGG